MIDPSAVRKTSEAARRPERRSGYGRGYQPNANRAVAGFSSRRSGTAGAVRQGGAALFRVRACIVDI